MRTTRQKHKSLDRENQKRHKRREERKAEMEKLAQDLERLQLKMPGMISRFLKTRKSKPSIHAEPAVMISTGKP